MRTGILRFFFLAPLGFAALGYNARTGWTALFLAAAGNSLISLAGFMVSVLPLFELGWEFLFFTVTASAFLWILVPPGGKSRFSRLPGTARFAAASSVCALLVLGVLFNVLEDEAFYGYVNTQLEMIKSLYLSSGADVVQNALLESLSVDFIVGTVKTMLERGGALASCMFLFFMNRQISLGLARIFRGKKRGAGMRAFHVPTFLIWVLSSSLLLVLLCRVQGLEILEIPAWNILTFCGILYFAQGLGIIQYILAGPSVPPSRRILISIVLILLLFIFGINAIILGLVMLLGVAENWVSLRRPETSGSPPTPGV
jgi:hypothetical protein